jgi:hypothetical protein
MEILHQNEGVDFTSSDLTGMQLDGQTYADPDKQITGILHTQEGRSTPLISS